MSTVTRAFSNACERGQTTLPATSCTALLALHGKEKGRESACTEKKIDTYVKFAPK
jgi:hypothetical protein